MVKNASDLDFDTLAKLAKLATGDVRRDASARGILLPVWRDGKVVYEDPRTGQVYANETDRPVRPSAEAIPGNTEEKLQALRDAGITLPFDQAPKQATAPMKRPRAAND